jgi:hypothetical protein|nr:MAG TPA: V-type proton ATPase subunit [Caudoviricetes sp.]
MKKVAKNCVIGAIIYGVCQLCFDAGKGYMLGIMAKHNDECNPVEAIDILSNDDGKHKLRSKFIAEMAEGTVETINKQYEEEP